MKKVCVYQDAEAIRRSINWCETVANKLQELADDLSEINITPTIEKIQSLYSGESLWDLITESCDNQDISSMPKRIQELLRKDTTKDVDNIKAKAAKLIHTDVSPIEWELYQVNNGKVSIKPEYKQIITDRFSIYIDTDSRSAVYEKWLENNPGKDRDDYNAAGYYFDYSNNNRYFGHFDVDWDVALSYQFLKCLQVTLQTSLKYYPGTLIAAEEGGNPVEKERVQFKGIIGLGVGYSF